MPASDGAGGGQVAQTGRRMAPCASACPAGEPVRAWVTALRDGTPDDLAKAWRILVASNPFPAVMGRICYAPCEPACRRTRVDGAVSIRALERHLGDRALREGWALPPAAPPAGRRVIVIGAGPSGLAAAYHLARTGHEVVVREAQPRPGGLLRRGITDSRLPKSVLDGEIDRILGLGVELETGRTVRRVGDALGEADGVVWAVGASMCMALVTGRTLWQQPVHVDERARRTATVSIGRGLRAAAALAAHLAGSESESASASVATVDPLESRHVPLRPVRPRGNDGPDPDAVNAAREARRCLSCGAAVQGATVQGAADIMAGRRPTLDRGTSGNRPAGPDDPSGDDR